MTRRPEELIFVGW